MRPQIAVAPQERLGVRFRRPWLDRVGDSPKRASAKAFELPVVGSELLGILDIGPADHVLAHVAAPRSSLARSASGRSEPACSPDRALSAFTRVFDALWRNPGAAEQSAPSFPDVADAPSSYGRNLGLPPQRLRHDLLAA